MGSAIETTNSGIRIEFTSPKDLRKFSEEANNLEDLKQTIINIYDPILKVKNEHNIALEQLRHENTLNEVKQLAETNLEVHAKLSKPAKVVIGVTALASLGTLGLTIKNTFFANSKKK